MGDLARISALGADIASWTEDLEDLQGKSGRIEKAIQDLEKKILDIGGAKLLTQKSKVDGIHLHINLANDEITKAEVAKAKAEKDVAKLKASLEANTTAFAEATAEVQELENHLEEVNGYVTELQGTVEEAKAAADNAKEDLNKLKRQLDEKSEEVQGFRQKEVRVLLRLSGR